MEGNQPLLRFDRVTKRFAGRAVLRNISLSVRRGEALAVVGPNGSGKSTLLRLATGLVAVDEGRIERPEHPAPLRIGYAPDRLPPLKFTSTEYLLHMGRIRGIPREKLLLQIAELHERFRLAAGPARMSEFSKGMVQKVNLMQALLGEPDLLLLDEPLSGLDDRSQRELLVLLEEKKRDGMAIVAATHEPKLAAHLADRCVTLINGELAGEPERSRSSRRRIVCTAPDKVLDELRAADGIERAELADGRGSYLLRAEAADRFLLTALLAGASIESVTADL
jgi:ABC-type multidrug transport system ATPase subunit